MLARFSFPNASITYREILQIALPLVIASFGYSVIGAVDTFFLGRSGDTAFLAAIGLIAPFYLVVSLVSLALARGGQIIIARLLGEGRLSDIGLVAQNMFYFQMALAVIAFLLLQLAGHALLYTFIDSPKLLELSHGYLKYRIWGVFFGCAGVAYISLYTGLARTPIIIVSSLIVMVVNVLLDYGLVFGNWGLPRMEMNGAGLASAIAEVVGLLVFVIYSATDKASRTYRLFSGFQLNLLSIKAQLSLSIPSAVQSALSLIGWVLFFGLIENYGEQSLAVSSVMRVIYLFLGAIGWGIGAVTNTIISMQRGQKKYASILPNLHKITWLAILLSAFAGVLLLIFPKAAIQLVTDSPSVIQDTLPMMPMMFVLLLNVAFYTNYFNGIIGMGEIKAALRISIISITIYIIYMTVIIKLLELNLYWAWSSELVYGILAWSFSLNYLKRNY